MYQLKHTGYSDSTRGGGTGSFSTAIVDCVRFGGIGDVQDLGPHCEVQRSGIDFVGLGVLVRLRSKKEVSRDVIEERVQARYLDDFSRFLALPTILHIHTKQGFEVHQRKWPI